MTARRGDLVRLTVVQARELPIGSLLEEVDGSATWWKRTQNTWVRLDPEVVAMQVPSAMAGRTFWVLRGDSPAS